MSSRNNNALRKQAPLTSKRLLLAFVTVYIVGICMKQLPAIGAAPLPSYLKSNGMILSIALIVFVGVRSRGSFLSERSAGKFIPFVLYAVITTAIMSLVLYAPLGTLYGETTISVALPSYLWLAMMILTMLALSYLFNQAGPAVLDFALEILTVFVIAIGLLQVMEVATGIPVYDALQSTGLFQNIFNGRISTIGTEPSSNGGIICMLVLPFVVSKVMKGSHWRFKLYAALLVILIFYVSSSQCYIAFLALVLGFSFVYWNRLIGHKGVVLLALIGALCCAGFLIISMSGSDVLESEPVQKLHYYLFEKASDQNNGSTVTRSSTLINDLCVFLQFPLFGCGEGIQGFFFNENVSSHMNVGTSVELTNLLAGKSGVVGPGCFITAILSSFGLVGMFLFLRALFKNLSEAKVCRGELGGYYEMSVMALFAAIPMGFVGISFAGSWSMYVIIAFACLRPCGHDSGVAK